MKSDVLYSLVTDYLQEDSSLIILEIDRDGLIISANQYVVELQGKPLIGHHISAIFTDFNANLSFSDLIDKPLKKVLLNVNTRQNIPQTFYFTTLTTGESTILIGETNSIEIEQLRISMIGLNNELNNLTRELQKRNIQLDQLNQMKNQFLGMAAHDLRNPIGNIMMYSEFVLEEESDKLSPEVSEILEIIHRSSQFMLNLLDDLLDIVKIESGKLDLNFELLDISNFLRQNVRINSMMASKKQIRILLNLPEALPLISFDSGKITQVVNNLITNAVKFSASGTSITVSAFQTATEIYISVQDQGQGIPKNELDMLFKPFSKLSVKSTGGEKSTGLGLNIAKRIIIGHQGRIWVDSELGKGTTFTFSLPIIKS